MVGTADGSMHLVNPNSWRRHIRQIQAHKLYAAVFVHLLRTVALILFKVHDLRCCFWRHDLLCFFGSHGSHHIDRLRGLVLTRSMPRFAFICVPCDSSFAVMFILRILAPIFVVILLRCFAII